MKEPHEVTCLECAEKAVRIDEMQKEIYRLKQTARELSLAHKNAIHAKRGAETLLRSIEFAPSEWSRHTRAIVEEIDQ